MTPPALHRMLACLLLAGCALVDQKTFAPAPEAKAASLRDSSFIICSFANPRFTRSR